MLISDELEKAVEDIRMSALFSPDWNVRHHTPMGKISQEQEPLRVIRFDSDSSAFVFAEHNKVTRRTKSIG